MKDEKIYSNENLFIATHGIEVDYVEKIEDYIVNTNLITTDEEQKLISKDIINILHLTGEIKDSLYSIQRKCCKGYFRENGERDYDSYHIDKKTGKRYKKRYER